MFLLWICDETAPSMGSTLISFVYEKALYFLFMFAFEYNLYLKVSLFFYELHLVLMTSCFNVL